MGCRHLLQILPVQGLAGQHPNPFRAVVASGGEAQRSSNSVSGRVYSSTKYVVSEVPYCRIGRSSNQSPGRLESGGYFFGSHTYFPVGSIYPSASPT